MTDERKWHERTSTLAAASLAALTAIALIVWGALFVSRQFNQPEQAPTEFVTPSFSDDSGRSTSAATTTTETITSTSPPATTDINDPDATTSSTTSSTTTTTTRRTTSQSRDDETTTSRRRPRFNETRTLSP
ncbi:hypothetical protein [Mycolicibacterium fluoranthenivorans]|uniref:Cytoskeletal protein RodZ n=1 Tax=Mycolicibacterium fluoranthenivorans TaxID=258505 RepID=A0A7X5ZB12_9MYCO|nr:hypothetical protein [Mycolicibacterium fluoranthenivorans]NIH93929.1 cytoskeletal protein RodZ [Mycolicibacterium fluoranthenivorans]